MRVCKSEVICSNPDMTDPLPGAQRVDPTSACLLGSPIGDVSSTHDAFAAKTQLLHTMGDKHIPAHDALLLLRNSLAIPKLLNLLRSSPCFACPALTDYDDTLRLLVGDITNTYLDDSPWTQASLLVCAGGLDIRSAVQLASLTFLSAAAASLDLVHLTVLDQGGCHMLMLPLSHGQKVTLRLHLVVLQPITRRLGILAKRLPWWLLYLRMPQMQSRACLLAVSTKESGAWLNALPITSLDLREWMTTQSEWLLALV